MGKYCYSLTVIYGSRADNNFLKVYMRADRYTEIDRKHMRTYERPLGKISTSIDSKSHILGNRVDVLNEPNIYICVRPSPLPVREWQSLAIFTTPQIKVPTITASLFRSRFLAGTVGTKHVLISCYH